MPHEIDPRENRRILLIDDKPTIHGDFRKILVAPNPPSLDQEEKTLFGDTTVKFRLPIFKTGIFRSVYHPD
jgi:hypothetical protein